MILKDPLDLNLYFMVEAIIIIGAIMKVFMVAIKIGNFDLEGHYYFNYYFVIDYCFPYLVLLKMVEGIIAFIDFMVVVIITS